MSEAVTSTTTPSGEQLEGMFEKVRSARRIVDEAEQALDAHVPFTDRRALRTQLPSDLRVHY